MHTTMTQLTAAPHGTDFVPMPNQDADALAIAAAKDSTTRSYDGDPS
ncbi:MAG TPA: hypothetical protein VFX52_05405 [Nocardioidaceae bacterium]|nr:hypothetical protein [Nocardioidaceae bacterium]